MRCTVPRVPFRRWKPRLAAAAASLVVWLAAGDLLAAGGKPATKLVNVADTRALPPGFTKWVADLYNTSHWLFALVVVVVMSGMGLALGLLCDRLVALLGINLGRLSHHE